MNEWKTLSRSVRLRHGRFLVVEEHTVQLPDGWIIADWPWVDTPDYAVVIAFRADGRAPIFRQHKYAIEGVTLAPPGGYIEPGEPPEAAARRELLEETGGEAERWTSLGKYRVDSNRGAGHAHLFLAEGWRQTCDPCADDLEEQELLWMDRIELREALHRGAFKSLAWVALVSLGLDRIAESGAKPVSS